jgi:predicted Fe-Mo cluster-binding NifX family protein
VKVDKKQIKSVEQIRIITNNEFEKLNFIISLKPDAVICNGLTTFYEAEFHKNNIEVLPWIHGEFEEVVKNFINGKFKNNRVIM